LGIPQGGLCHALGDRRAKQKTRVKEQAGGVRCFRGGETGSGVDWSVGLWVSISENSKARGGRGSLRENTPLLRLSSKGYGVEVKNKSEGKGRGGTIEPFTRKVKRVRRGGGVGAGRSEGKEGGSRECD